MLHFHVCGGRFRFPHHFQIVSSVREAMIFIANLGDIGFQNKKESSDDAEARLKPHRSTHIEDTTSHDPTVSLMLSRERKCPYHGHLSDRKDTTCGDSTRNLCQTLNLHHFQCRGHQEYIKCKTVFFIKTECCIFETSILDSVHIIPWVCSLTVGVCR